MEIRPDNRPKKNAASDAEIARAFEDFVSEMGALVRSMSRTEEIGDRVHSSLINLVGLCAADAKARAAVLAGMAKFDLGKWGLAGPDPSRTCHTEILDIDARPGADGKLELSINGGSRFTLQPRLMALLAVLVAGGPEWQAKDSARAALGRHLQKMAPLPATPIFERPDEERARHTFDNLISRLNEALRQQGYVVITTGPRGSGKIRIACKAQAIRGLEPVAARATQTCNI